MSLIQIHKFIRRVH